MVGSEVRGWAGLSICIVDLREAHRFYSERNRKPLKDDLL